MRRPVVYVAGPITKGDLHENVRRAFAAGVGLLRAGLSPLVPHGSCFWGCRAVASSDFSRLGYQPEILPAGTTHGDWYGMDLELVARCDALLRLPGESAGADLEEAEAARLGLPVFRSVEEAVAHFVGRPPFHANATPSRSMA